MQIYTDYIQGQDEKTRDGFNYLNFELHIRKPNQTISQ